jgi:antitoxin component YwqK of YwqJK toxin-antitoxin module
MKYPHIFILCLFLTVSVYSQDTVNRVNAQGLKEGYWRKLDTAGMKVYEGHFRNGIPSGTFRYFYPSGTLRVISAFSADGKRSRTTTFFPSGKKMAEGVYLEEKRDSLWQFYSEYDGSKLSEESYKKGKKEGVAKTFYPGKGLAEVVNWRDGLREGPWIQYYTDGTVKMKANNHSDKKHGVMEVFSEKGTLIISGKYAEGDPDGTWLFYDEKGKIEKKEVYDKGALVSSEEMKSGK